MTAFDRLGVRPQQIILTNRRHRREAARFQDALDCAVRIGARAVFETDGLEAEPFEDGDVA
jgi:hypothetical protein